MDSKSAPEQLSWQIEVASCATMRDSLLACAFAQPRRCSTEAGRPPCFQCIDEIRMRGYDGAVALRVASFHSIKMLSMLHVCGRRYCFLCLPPRDARYDSAVFLRPRGG